MKLRLGHRLERIKPVLHNGPGWRLSIWVQGCRHRCTTQCLNPELLNLQGGFEYTVAEALETLTQRLAMSAFPVEGITILGGEPFEQAPALAMLLIPLKAKNLTTMVYSGHTYEDLLTHPEPGVKALLNVTDILVDGPFMADFYEEHLAWRGSTNQRLLCLSEAYTPAQLEYIYSQQKKGVSLQLAPDSVIISGLQNREGLLKIKRFFSQKEC